MCQARKFYLIVSALDWHECLPKRMSTGNIRLPFEAKSGKQIWRVVEWAWSRSSTTSCLKFMLLFTLVSCQMTCDAMAEVDPMRDILGLLQRRQEGGKYLLAVWTLSTGILCVESAGREAKRCSIDSASSRSRRASMKDGYLASAIVIPLSYYLINICRQHLCHYYPDYNWLLLCTWS